MPSHLTLTTSRPTTRSMSRLAALEQSKGKSSLHVLAASKRISHKRKSPPPQPKMKSVERSAAASPSVRDNSKPTVAVTLKVGRSSAREKKELLDKMKTAADSPASSTTVTASILIGAPEASRRRTFPLCMAGGRHRASGASLGPRPAMVDPTPNPCLSKLHGVATADIDIDALNAPRESEPFRYLGDDGQPVRAAGDGNATVNEAVGGQLGAERATGVYSASGGDADEPIPVKRDPGLNRDLALRNETVPDELVDCSMVSAPPPNAASFAWRNAPLPLPQAAPSAGEWRRRALIALSTSLENVMRASRRVGRQARHGARQLEPAHFEQLARAVRICAAIGETAELGARYRSERALQLARLTLPPTEMTTGKHFADWLDAILGFFVVEEFVCVTEASLATQEQKAALWATASSEVLAVLDKHCGLLDSVKMMLHFKQAVLLFTRTAQSYGLDIEGFHSLLQGRAMQYVSLLVNGLDRQLLHDVHVNFYEQITVGSQQQLDELAKLFPAYRHTLVEVSFPYQIAHSQLACWLQGSIQMFLRRVAAYGRYIPLLTPEYMHQSLNTLLTRWSEHLKAFIRERQRTLVELIQITVDMSALVRAVEGLGPDLVKLILAELGEHAATPDATPLREARTLAEQLIIEMLQVKVDYIFKCASYDWERPAARGKPSLFISELIMYLQSTFTWMRERTATLTIHYHTQICGYVADALMEMVQRSDSRRISKGALEQFSLDVMQCEMFAARGPVDGLDAATPPIAFSTLRQLIDLVLNDEWSTFLAEYRNERRQFDRVKATDVIPILEKKIEFEKKAAGMLSLKGSDRRKLLETVLKQLRMHANER